MYEQVTEGLRSAYDRAADDRDKKEISPWKVSERQAYLQMLQQEGKEKLAVESITNVLFCKRERIKPRNLAPVCGVLLVDMGSFCSDCSRPPDMVVQCSVSRREREYYVDHS